MKKPIVLIKDLGITVKTRNVLAAMGVFTTEDLHLMYVLETIPSIGTNVKHYPYVGIDLIYSKKVNAEVKQILRENCGVTDELEHLGVPTRHEF